MFSKTKVEIVDFQKEQRRRERKETFKRKVNEAVQWCNDNREFLIIAIPAGVAITKCGTKLISKAVSTHNLNKEIRFKERTIYDHSLGRYVELRRKLTSAEALSIEERRANGEKLHMILDDMNLLKR